jgi:hypothetical protein
METERIEAKFMRKTIALALIVSFGLLTLAGCSSDAMTSPEPNQTSEPTDEPYVEPLPDPKVELADSKSADISACKEIRDIDNAMTPGADLQSLGFDSVLSERMDSPDVKSVIIAPLEDFIFALDAYHPELKYPNDGKVDVITTLSSLLVACSKIGVKVGG